MSHFYGTLQGSRGQATRCGTRGSGITTETASWDGAVRASLRQPDPWAPADRSPMPVADVELIRWHGTGRYLTLYRGPVRPTDDDLVAGLLPDTLPAKLLRKVARELNRRAREQAALDREIGTARTSSEPPILTAQREG